MQVAAACPDEAALDAYLGDADAFPEIEGHLGECSACREVVALLVRSGRASTTGRSAAGLGPLWAGDPERIGRYLILERLGEGAMGVVFAAYDPDLDRRVAIKVLHPLPEAMGTEERARLIREARALARVDHPQVVAVYDVGVMDPWVWLAMELVGGETLAAWARGGTRPWRAALDLTLQAARGLRAIHDAGLLHRDVKPTNVMVEARRDGDRIRIMDFGLARGAHRAHGLSVAGSGTSAAQTVESTTAGLIGTPAYMAAEQLRGGPATEKSDQFSLCATMWEALMGERPYTGATLLELQQHVEAGTPTMPPSARAVPHWLRRVLQRGLAPNPDARYPTVADLLTDLERGRNRGRRRVQVLAAAVVIATPIGIWVDAEVAEYEARLADTEQRRLCAEESATLGAIWGPDARRRVHDALAAVDVAYAEASTRETLRRLDLYAQAWAEQRTAACEAGTVDMQWPNDRLARARRCLDERALDLEALVDELADADAGVLENAVTAAARLESVTACADLRLLDDQSVPNDAAGTEVRRLLAQARATQRAGRYDATLRHGEQAMKAADRIGDPGLVATASILWGTALHDAERYEDAENALERAYFSAAGARQWSTATLAAHELMSVVGISQARHEDGLRWAKLAELASALAPEDALRDAEGKGQLGNLYVETGNRDAAVELFEASLATHREQLGDEHPIVAMELGAMGYGLLEAGEYKRAQSVLEEALALQRKIFGAAHPLLMVSMSNLADCYERMGDSNRSLELYEDALALTVERVGREGHDVGVQINNLAFAYERAGRIERAQTLYREALGVLERAVGPDHPDVTLPLANLGGLLKDAGAFDDARALLQRALEIKEATLGPDHPDTAITVNGLGQLYQSMGDLSRAREHFERSLAIRSAALGPDDPRTATAMFNLGHLEELAGAADRAVPHFAESHRILVRALGEEHPRAIKHAEAHARALKASAAINRRGSAARSP